MTLITLMLLQAPGLPAAAPGAVQLTCDFGDSAPRVFRLGAGLLQEWHPDRREFGPNLCDSFRCSSEGGKLKGSIESASVIFKLELDPSRRSAAWRSVGASGRRQTSGACSVGAVNTAPSPR